VLPKDNPRSILVIKFRNIGDVLLTTPVFANLRAAYPDARICALVNSGTEEMLTGNPDIDRVFVYDRGVKRFSRTARLREEMKLLSAIRRERFDTVCNLTEGDRGAVAALFSGARTRIGVDALGRGMPFKNRIFTRLLAPPDQSLHAVDQNLYFLEAAGIPVTAKQVSFHFSSEDASFVADLLACKGITSHSYCHAHMTSRWMFKTLPIPTAALFIEQFAALSGLPVVMTAAPLERELDYLRELVAACRIPLIDLGGQLTLKQMGALSARASCFAGVDSAPMHIAAAVNTPVLALFGPTSVRIWGPWDNDLGTNPYQASRGVQRSRSHLVLQSDRECVPCHRDGCNGSKKSDCLDFNMEAIQSACAVFLAHLATGPDRMKTE